MNHHHYPRIWEVNRFWMREQEFGRSRYVAPIPDEFSDIEFPEHLRMPVTRGEKNRFVFGLKKSLASAKHGRTVSLTYVMAKIDRKLRALERKQSGTESSHRIEPN